MADEPKSKPRLLTSLSDYEREVLEAIRAKHGIRTKSGAIKACIRAVGIKLGVGTNIFPADER